MHGESIRTQTRIVNSTTMSYGVNAYRPSGIQSYAKAAEMTAPQPAAQSAAPKAAADLSRDEDEMIRKFFPGSESMSLRLYGPERTARTVNPHALGSRFDMQG